MYYWWNFRKFSSKFLPTILLNNQEMNLSVNSTAENLFQFLYKINNNRFSTFIFYNLQISCNFQLFLIPPWKFSAPFVWYSWKCDVTVTREHITIRQRINFRNFILIWLPFDVGTWRAFDVHVARSLLKDEGAVKSG